MTNYMIRQTTIFNSHVKYEILPPMSSQMLEHVYKIFTMKRKRNGYYPFLSSFESPQPNQKGCLLHGLRPCVDY